MPVLSRIFLIFIITSLGVSARDEDQCDDTELVVSKCYNPGKYQWYTEVPRTKKSCEGKSIAEPKAVPCDFACAKGETFDKNTLGCKKCSEGTFSLGGGFQYTFSDLEDLSVTKPELSLITNSFVDAYDDECKKKGHWQVKGNILQSDVQPNCGSALSLPFKLERPGSINITYNLATSYVVGTISSRCGFGIKDKSNDDDDDDDEVKKRAIVTLRPTGYGVWKVKEVVIKEAGEYILSLYTFGFNTLHFPFAIRSIIIEGYSFIQDCIQCPPGTFSANTGSDTCTPCPVDTYAHNEGSTECIPCKANEYADEESATCTKRPTCEAKHYRKVFTGCDKSNMATIKYEPIQPKLCIDGSPPADEKQSPCGTCNPGMYKKTDSDVCEFCPAHTYSNGTLQECLKCDNDLSLLPGLYYKIWNELPTYLTRSYMSFEEEKNLKRFHHNQSWIPSIEYISSQPLPDTLSVLSLTIAKGFNPTAVAKMTREYGSLYFKFSITCQSSCSLFLVSQDINDDNADDWEVIRKWNVKLQPEHKDIIEYTYSVSSPSEIIFNWLFASDDIDQGTAEIRIYEIRLTNTILGGSDRCVTCLTVDNQETKCQSCAPGTILSNDTCIRCPSSTIASRVRYNDPVPTVCKPCPNNTISDDGSSCYVPCKQAFHGDIQYDLNAISTIEFHGSKLFTQKGSGYFHIFNASICGKTSVSCAKTASSSESKHSTNQNLIESKLCRIGSVSDKSDSAGSVAYVDDFGEQLLNVSLSTSKYFPPLRSDYNLTDITFVYQANTSSSQSTCTERITFLSLRCDYLFDDEKQDSSLKYKLQTPSDCSTGTCDGCTFQFLLRTPLACPTCDENTNGFRTFVGPCKFGRQEVRKIPFPYCSHNLTEKVDIHRCSILSLEIDIIIGLFVIVAGILILVVIFCWRKNRKLEYRYMQLVENANPDDDTPADNVCAQISDEEDSGDEVQFKKQSRTKKIMNAVRKAIRKNPNNGQSDSFRGDSFLLTNTSTNDV